MAITVKERIKRHEGKRNRPYRDSEGILTVGYGRNLEAVPFTDHELDVMFDTDFERAELAARSFPQYMLLSPVRRGVLVEMCFQMGYGGVKKFRRFLDAIDRSKWNSAADEMLDSKWAEQTPGRAKELARIFKDG